jgi:hypothetical protein
MGIGYLPKNTYPVLLKLNNMKAIYAFKIFKGHYKPLNENFINLAKLSVKSAKKYYKTKFYCDQESLDFFTENDIIFDEIVIMDNFVNDYPNQSSISKIYAMMNESEPYILLDFDTVLLEELYTPYTITYGHPEVNLNMSYVNVGGISYVNDFYIIPFNENIKKYYNQDDLSKFNWALYPSFCLVIVKNPTIMSTIFKTLFSLISKEDMSRIPPMLIEQFLSHQYIIKHKVDFGFITQDHYYNDGDFSGLELITKKYVHLHINKKMIKDEIKYLENII